MTTLYLRLLGPLHVSAADEGALALPSLVFPTRKAEALLAYLAVEHQQVHNRDTLVGLLWPDIRSDKARLSARVALSHVRSVLEGAGARPHFQTTKNDVQLMLDGCWLDVVEFTRGLRGVEGHGHRADEVCDQCQPALAQAVSLYRGTFLEGLFLDECQLFDEWLFMQRERFRMQVLGALGKLTVYELRQGRADGALTYAQRQLEIDPLHEDAHHSIMRAYMAQGWRADALRQYELCRAALLAELGVEPAQETRRLFEEIVSGGRTAAMQAAPVPAADYAAAARLPSYFTSFIGRQDELAQLDATLRSGQARLITLVGAGGMGKTRLAVEAAAQQQERFADGVHFVPFASVQDAATVVDTLAAALGVTFRAGDRTPQAQLLDWLRPRRTLLVLDNLEHLLACAPFLLEILHAAPQVKILTTSREPLGVQAEDQIALTGLEVPSAEDLESAGHYPAVRLFVDRAYRVNKRFRLHDGNVADVLRICRLVEGRPLGLELAAVHAATHSCRTIADAIVADLDFLAVELPDLPPRQRSLRAVFEQSWQTLTPAEQSAFARLSTFRTPFDQNAAIAVAGASLSILTRLSNTRLINFHEEYHSDGERFQIHELLRQFAATKLAAMLPNRSALERRHAEYFLSWLSRQDQIRNGTQPRRCAETIQTVLDDVRAAWAWASASGAVDLLARALPVLAGFYTLRGMHAESERVFRMTLSQISEEEVALRAHLLVYLGAALEKQGKVDETRTTLNQGIALAEQSGAFEALGFGYLTLARLTLNIGTIDEALSWTQRGLDSLPGADFRSIKTDLLLFHGIHESSLGNQNRDKGAKAFAEARAILAQTGNKVQEQRLLYYEALDAASDNYPAARFYLEQAQALCAITGDRSLEARVNQSLGYIHERLGNYETAIHFHLRGLSLSTADQDSRMQTFGLHNLCLCYDQIGDFTEAYRCGQQGLAIAERDGLNASIGYMKLHLGHVMARMALLGDAKRTLLAAQECFVAVSDLYLLCETSAYLAHVEYRLDNQPAALAYVEQVLSQMEPRVLVGMDAPMRACLYCYQILTAAKDNRAQDVLDAAYQYIQTRAALLDAVERERFLSAVPANRAILAAWKAKQ